MQKEYTENSNYIFEKYTGNESEVFLPAMVGGKPLVGIGAKAFLSCKTVEILSLPDTLDNVGDWAFAHMKQLKEIVLPAKDIIFGKKVFLGCGSLKKVKFSGPKSENIYEGISFLLADVMRVFPEDIASSLMDLSDAGDIDKQWKWLSAYDTELKKYMDKSDEEGFVPAFIGWFDIEDVDDQKEDFIRNTIRDKLFLAFDRLIYKERLEPQMKKFLEGYLGGNADLLIDTLIEDVEYGRNIDCYRVLYDAGILSESILGRLLDALNEEPEIIAYLLNLQMENSDQSNFFGNLEL